MTTNGVPGFSEGYRLGQAFADMMFSNRGMVIAHRIPGRRRYYAKRLIGNEELAKLLETSLVKLDYVDEVKASHITGSLLNVCSAFRTTLSPITVYVFVSKPLKYPPIENTSL